MRKSIVVDDPALFFLPITALDAMKLPHAFRYLAPTVVAPCLNGLDAVGWVSRRIVPSPSVLGLLVVLVGHFGGHATISAQPIPYEDVPSPSAEIVIESAVNACPTPNEDQDRFWLLDVRHLTSDVCRVALPVCPRVMRLDSCGRGAKSDFNEYLRCIGEGRPSVIYVHGNRMPASNVVERGMYVYHHSAARHRGPIDWVIWSWPSQREGIATHDVRVKADRTDGQGLMVADLLRHHTNMGTPTTLVGFSFGGRVITGALHALAGGALGGYGIPGETIEGANFTAALLAPAIEQNWMATGGYHDLATRNLESLSVLYNRRDAILKRYWLIDRVRGQRALGFSGPRNFAPRYDGSKLPVESRDCSPIVGLQHDERDYYKAPCSAGRELTRILAATATGLTNLIASEESSVSTETIASQSDSSVASEPVAKATANPEITQNR